MDTVMTEPTPDARSTNPPADPSVATMLPLSKIQTGSNPRRYFDRRKHDELVASLGRRGMLQPIVVRPVGPDQDLYEIIAGGRRYNAALEAFGPEGLVPVAIRVMTDQEALEAAIDENDVRDDTSETEQADGAAWHVAACAGDRAEAARRLGWSPAKLNRRLALANLSEPVKLALDERRIKVGHAELLAAVPTDKQEKALDTILSATLDVATTRDLLMRLTQSLGSASFDKGECAACPFNSTSQRALFETHVDDGHCTNPGCYQLKTETADRERAATAPPPDETPPDELQIASPSVTAPAADEETVTPPASAADPTSAKPARSKYTHVAASATTANSKSISLRALPAREAAWRGALTQAFEGDPGFEDAFNTILRAAWKVDADYLGLFGKDELKLIAQECGLVAHMGEKKFARLLDGKLPALVAGMLSAPGFDWAGRLPGAMTVDGEFSPPTHPSAPSPSDETKEPATC